VYGAGVYGAGVYGVCSGAGLMLVLECALCCVGVGRGVQEGQLVQLRAQRQEFSRLQLQSYLHGARLGVELGSY